MVEESNLDPKYSEIVPRIVQELTYDSIVRDYFLITARFVMDAVKGSDLLKRKRTVIKKNPRFLITIGKFLK